MNIYRVIFLISFFIVTSTSNAQTSTFEWVKQMGNFIYDNSESIGTDANGNVYTSGSFRDTVDFDPGPGLNTLITNGTSDIFIQKLDSNGNLLWVKQMAGTNHSYSVSLTIDLNGNIYNTGLFYGTTDFDPGPGTANLSTNGQHDIFIQKLDRNGNLLWVKQMGGSSSEFGRSIITDDNGNVYTTGDFKGTVDFDPNAGISNLTSLGSGDCFITKLDSNGNLIWVRQIGGSSFDWGQTITVDSQDNILIGGHFLGTADFDPGVGITNLTSNGNQDIFILKLNSSGNLIWVKQIGGSDTEYCESIVTDRQNNIYITGDFRDTVDFDPNTGIFKLSSIGFRDVYVQKLDSNGNLLWIKQMGGTGADVSESIALDNQDNVYTTGSFDATIDFDPGLGTTILTSNGRSDIFIHKLNSSGNFVWAKSIGSNELDFGKSITIDKYNTIYTTGLFSGTVDFESGPGITNLTSNGYQNIFIHKIRQALPVGQIENIIESNIQVFPNPTDRSFNIRFSKPQKEVRIRLISTAGKIIKTNHFYNVMHVNSEFNMPSGVYLVEIVDENQNKTIFRLIKK